MPTSFAFQLHLDRFQGRAVVFMTAAHICNEPLEGGRSEGSLDPLAAQQIVLEERE